MSSGQIDTVERIRRINLINELLIEGKTDKEISQELNIPIVTVKRNIRYIDDLKTADLSSEEIGEKRAELFVELLDAAEKAKTLYNDNIDNYKSARAAFISWMETIKLRMQLFGLDNVKTDNFTQINNLQVVKRDKIDSTTGERIAEMMKKDHERRVSQET